MFIYVDIKNRNHLYIYSIKRKCSHAHANIQMCDPKNLRENQHLTVRSSGGKGVLRRNEQCSFLLNVDNFTRPLMTVIARVVQRTSAIYGK